jgi:dihydroorotate dehydrogenase
LIQLYTGWIYEGPQLVPAILEGVCEQLDRHGFRNIGEAVGSGVGWR